MGTCLICDPVAHVPDDELDEHLRWHSSTPPALVLCWFHPDGMTFPPPWWVPIEAPSCGNVLVIPAERTNDNTERTFVCDKGWQDHADGRHRHVTDNFEGQSFEWPIGAAAMMTTP